MAAFRAKQAAEAAVAVKFVPRRFPWASTGPEAKDEDFFLEREERSNPFEAELQAEKRKKKKKRGY